MDLESLQLYTISTWIIPVLLAITFHEAAHAFAARACGDHTASFQGRVTLNPLKHIDPFGTVLLALLWYTGGFLFGYAKPVPVNFRAMRNLPRDMVWVALAGPGANIALATAAALLYHIVPDVPQKINQVFYMQAGLPQWLGLNLWNAIQLNVVLAIFNMIPLPPLDGGRVAMGLLPRDMARSLAELEPHGMLILLGLIFVLPFMGRLAHVDLNVLSWIVAAVGGPVFGFFQNLAGG